MFDEIIAINQILRKFQHFYVSYISNTIEFILAWDVLSYTAFA